MNYSEKAPAIPTVGPNGEEIVSYELIAPEPDKSLGCNLWWFEATLANGGFRTASWENHEWYWGGAPTFPPVPVDGAPELRLPLSKPPKR